MKRWKVWTSVAAGLLSVGGPGTYVGWQFLTAKSADQVLAQADVPVAASASETPKPIPVPDESAPLPFNPVARASFNAPQGDEKRVVRANDDQSISPSRPSASFKMGDDTPSTIPSESRGSSFQPQPLSSSEPSSSIAKPSSSWQPPSSSAAPPPSSSFAPAPLSQIDSDTTPAPAETDSPSPSRGSFNLSSPPAETEETTVSESPRGNLPPAPNHTNPAEIDSREESESPQASAAVTSSPQGGFGAPRAFEPPQSEPISSRQANSSRPKASSGARLSGQNPPSNIERTPPAPQVIRSTNDSGADSSLTSDAPGEKKLEGAQTPTLSLEKTAPDEIQVGKQAKFTIKVKNSGQTPALDVVVSDRVPQGTQFIQSTPEATPTRDGALAWQLGTIQPGEETTITVDLMPESEGEIGSIAQVTFHAQAAVRTIATRPLINLEHSGPAKVLIGEDVPFHIIISNPGSGVATGIVIEVDVPDQLAHEGGREIMSDRFDLRPNETRKLDLVMKAVQAGTVQNIVRAVGDANLAAEHRTQIEIVAPKLQVAVSGPGRRFLERQVTYQIAVANPGTASAKEVELVAYLPQGLKFIATEKKGEYDQQKHAVYWSLEELPAGDTGTVQLSAIPTDPGEQKLHVETTAALNLSANSDHTTIVEALTELVFTVSDENDPIEVGAQTSYEIRITNNGSKPATNVQLAALLPPELTEIKTDGPTKSQTKGQQIVMEPISELAPREEAVYRILVQGKKAGDHLIRVQIVSDEFSTPVTKEESTKVYADE